MLHYLSKSYILYISFLGTAGQTVDNMKMVMKENVPTMDIMKKTLAWRHIAPTAPDTLACFPFAAEDPFILESSPHVYFCGNQDKFETCLAEGAG